MMATLDKWRAYFGTANSDIFDIIENGIIVAASDCPNEFRSKRDRIAELLFSCKMINRSGCNRIELVLPSGNDLASSEEKPKILIEAGGIGSEENNMNMTRKYAYAETEALIDEIDEQVQLHEEILKIKQIIDNIDHEADSLVFDSLRRLQLMPLNVEILKATEIGKSVNAIRKHRTKEIQCLARDLVKDWKGIVDDWASAKEAIASDLTEAEVVTDSVKTSSDEGLPSPPMDEGVFFGTPTSMELSKIFDGMDDDGNLRDYRKSNSDNKIGPATIKSGPDRLKLDHQSQRTQRPMSRIEEQKPRTSLLKPKLDHYDQASDKMKLETAKRKLHERYQEAENAKKKRTIQFVELSDLPKQQSLVRRNNQQMKPRKMANTRR